MATNNEENANILHTHYHAVGELGPAPTPNEILSALKCMKNNKAPSFSEVTTKMLKNLPIDSLLLLTDFFCEYWINPKVDYESWHKAKLSNLYKGKDTPKIHEVSV